MKKYSYLCKLLYDERGNAVAGRLDDKIKRIHKEGGGKKEEEGLKGDINGGNDTREGEEREGAASLEASSDNNKIYGAIASGQGTTTTTKDDAKGDNEK